MGRRSWRTIASSRTRRCTSCCACDECAVSPALGSWYVVHMPACTEASSIDYQYYLRPRGMPGSGHVYTRMQVHSRRRLSPISAAATLHSYVPLQLGVKLAAGHLRKAKVTTR